MQWGATNAWVHRGGSSSCARPPPACLLRQRAVLSSSHITGDGVCLACPRLAVHKDGGVEAWEEQGWCRAMLLGQTGSYASEKAAAAVGHWDPAAGGYALVTRQAHEPATKLTNQPRVSLTRHAVLHHLSAHRGIHLLLASLWPKHACARWMEAAREGPVCVQWRQAACAQGRCHHLSMPPQASHVESLPRQTPQHVLRSKVAVKGSGLPPSNSITIWPPTTSRQGATSAAASRLLGGRTRTYTRMLSLELGVGAPLAAAPPPAPTAAQKASPSPGSPGGSSSSSSTGPSSPSREPEEAPRGELGSLWEAARAEAPMRERAAGMRLRRARGCRSDWGVKENRRTTR